MAIVSMNRFTLLTFHARKEKLLRALQVFGDVHFRSLGREELAELPFLRSGFSPERLSCYETELEKVRYSAQKLAPHAAKPKMTDKPPALSYEEFDRYADSYDYGAVYAKIREQDERIQNCRAEIARRASENDAMALWAKLDAVPAELDGLRQAGYLLGTVDKLTAAEFRLKMEERFDTAYVELLGTVKDDTALLMLFPAGLADEVFGAAREQGFTKASFALRGMPREVVADNDKEIAALEKRIVAAEAAVKALAPEYPRLEIALDYFGSVLERERAAGSFLASDTVLIIEGWVPAEDSQRLAAILKAVLGEEYYLEETPVEKDDEEVPIKLRNNAFISAFESITSMYAMPKYGEVDPTPLLGPFYWVFFGLMVGDIGYGLLTVVITTVALKIMSLKAGMRDFMRFFRYLGLATILAGILYGSFFGMSVFRPVADPAAEGGYRAIIDTQYSILTMLILSVVVGVVHIIFGLCIKTYLGFRDGKPMDAFGDGIIWIVTLLSAIGWLLAAVGFLPVPALATVCMWVFIACLVGIFLTQGRSSPSIGGKIGNGLYGVYGLTSYVGDIVSYTRIMALALAGAYIAYAFNIMTGLVVGEFGAGGILPSIIRLLFGALITLFGQALNFGLSLLGAYVHTARLQYVEYFGKFYEGGGVVFSPLSLKSENVSIQK